MKTSTEVRKEAGGEQTYFPVSRPRSEDRITRWSGV